MSNAGGSQVQGSNGSSRSNLTKTDKTRRIWSFREEEILLASLKELVALGWKSDNGFRAGYLTKLEDSIRREFPNTDLKVNPNIVSKLTAWKKNYGSLQGILSRSGVGFNVRGDHTIDCDDQQWEQIVKADPNARKMRNKSWPYLEDWKEIFGKDRANGGNAEDIMEAVNDLYANDQLGNIGGNGDCNISLDDISINDNTAQTSPSNDGGEGSFIQGENDKNTCKRIGRKRKADDGMESIINLLGKMHADTNARLEGLSSRIGYEVDLSKARKEVFEILGGIPGLSLDDKLDVGEFLVGKADLLDLFMGLPDVAKAVYVGRILSEKRKNQP